MSENSNPIKVVKNTKNSFSIETDKKYSRSPIINQRFTNPITTAINIENNDYNNLSYLALYSLPSIISNSDYENNVMITSKGDSIMLDNNICILFKTNDTIKTIGCSYDKTVIMGSMVKIIVKWDDLIWKLPLVIRNFKLSFLGYYDNPQDSPHKAQTDLLKLMNGAEMIIVTYYYY